MARPLRIEYQGALYHVTSRGSERRKIFLSKADYSKFLSYVPDALHKYGVLLHVYALMGNHYHLLVETPGGNLRSFMHALNSGYATYFNTKRRRTGHLFHGRYKAILVEKESYLLELSRYVHLNPVRACIGAKPEDYPYTSYLAYIHPEEETLVSRDLIWGMVSTDIQVAPQRYREYVEAAFTAELARPLEKIYGGIILGRKPFIREALQRLTEDNLRRKDLSHRRILTSTTSDIQEIVHILSRHFNVFEETIINSYPYRGYAVYLARKHTPVSNADIGRYFGNISYSAVTKIGTRLKQRIAQDDRLQEVIGTIEKELSYANRLTHTYKYL
jgi:putative transposase